MRTNTTRVLILACAPMLAQIGCTSSGHEDAGAELGAGTGSLAMLRLDSFVQDDGSPQRLVANAKVARYSGLDASSVLKLLGVDAPEGESCTVGGRLDAFPLNPDAKVELLSVGDISLRVGDRTQTLSPRLFPDLASTASGWFYAGNAELLLSDGGAALLPDGGAERGDEYALAAPGEQGVGHFELSVVAPGEVLGLNVDGSDLEEGATLGRGSDLALTWEPEDLRDQVEIELQAGGAVLSCSARDDGQFTLPQAKLALLEADPQASFLVRRVRVVAADMQGIETAYARLATTVSHAIKLD